MMDKNEGKTATLYLVASALCPLEELWIPVEVTQLQSNCNGGAFLCNALLLALSM